MNKTIGQIVVASEEYESWRKRLKSSVVIDVKTALLSGSWVPVPPEFVPMPAYVPPYLRLRQMLANLQTASNLVEAPQETAQGGGADYQTTENTSKASSDFTYALGKFPVATIATWVQASRQVVDDSAAFSGYLDTRMTQLIELKVEKELLYGDGATGHITGLTVNATAATGGTTSLDKITAAMGQLAALGIIPDGVVVNPADWITMIAAKTGTGDYPAGGPLYVGRPATIWGFPVSFSSQMLAGKFLVGGFLYAAIFNRQNATIEIARSNTTDFVTNMLTILGEERLALAIYKPTAFVYGSL